MERLPESAVLWREGDAAVEVVYLEEGTVEVLNEGQGNDGEAVVLSTMHEGEIVGEIAGMDGRARSATVRARTPCTIVRMSADVFREIVRRRADLLEELYWKQVNRVRNLTSQVEGTHRRAITDKLTQLYNYGFFAERLVLELERAAATGDPVSLVLFDIDHFKKYNDTHGHPAGNVALETVARLLKGAGRRGDIVARYGGEEFVALLYGATRDEAAKFAEGVRVAVEQTSFPGGETQPLRRVTVSAGVACYPDDARSEKELVDAADANLYRAKESGRNRVVARDASG